MDEIDPYIMYLIVRKSLNMSTGKIGAQIGHGVEHIMLAYFKMLALSVRKDFHIISEDNLEKVKIMTYYLDHGSRKVILIADDKDFENIKIEFKNPIVIKDAGLTEVLPNSETLIALFPIKKSQSPKAIKRLQTLKDK